MERCINVKQTPEYIQGYTEGFKDGYSKAFEQLRKEFETINIAKEHRIVIEKSDKSKWEDCDNCSGEGEIFDGNINRTCGACWGMGRV